MDLARVESWAEMFTEMEDSRVERWLRIWVREILRAWRLGSWLSSGS